VVRAITVLGSGDRSSSARIAVMVSSSADSGLSKSVARSTPSERVVGLMQHPAHPSFTVGGSDDRDELALADKLAFGFDLVEDAADRRQDVGHVRAAAVVPDRAVNRRRAR
jgi:hypothetical protein